jgi:hypothetical protein
MPNYKNKLTYLRNKLATLEVLSFPRDLTWDQIETLAKKRGIKSSRTIGKHLKALNAEGLIGHNGQTYRITEEGINEIPLLKEKIKKLESGWNLFDEARKLFGPAPAIAVGYGEIPKGEGTTRYSGTVSVVKLEGLRRPDEPAQLNLEMSEAIEKATQVLVDSLPEDFGWFEFSVAGVKKTNDTESTTVDTR